MPGRCFIKLYIIKANFYITVVCFWSVNCQKHTWNQTQFSNPGPASYGISQSRWEAEMHHFRERHESSPCINKLLWPQNEIPFCVPEALVVLEALMDVLTCLFLPGLSEAWPYAANHSLPLRTFSGWRNEHSCLPFLMFQPRKEKQKEDNIILTNALPTNHWATCKGWLERWESWGSWKKRTNRNEAVGVKKEYGRK